MIRKYNYSKLTQVCIVNKLLSHTLWNSYYYAEPDHRQATVQVKLNRVEVNYNSENNPSARTALSAVSNVTSQNSVRLGLNAQFNRHALVNSEHEEQNDDSHPAVSVEVAHYLQNLLADFSD